MKRYTWTITVTMDETWVEDGFDLTDERASLMVQAAYPHVNGNEVSCKVLKRPPDAEVAAAMGFKTVEAYLTDRDGHLRNAWYALPCPCGAKDPIYRGPHGQECAKCGAIRYEPGHEPKEQTP